MSSVALAARNRSGAFWCFVVFVQASCASALLVHLLHSLMHRDIAPHWEVISVAKEAPGFRFLPLDVFLLSWMMRINCGRELGDGAGWCRLRLVLLCLRLLFWPLDDRCEFSVACFLLDEVDERFGRSAIHVWLSPPVRYQVFWQFRQHCGDKEEVVA